MRGIGKLAIYILNVATRLALLVLTTLAITAIAIGGGFFTTWLVRLVHPDFIERFGFFPIALSLAAATLITTVFWSRDLIKYIASNLVAIDRGE